MSFTWRTVSSAKKAVPSDIFENPQNAKDKRFPGQIPCKIKTETKEKYIKKNQKKLSGNILGTKPGELLRIAGGKEIRT